MQGDKQPSSSVDEDILRRAEEYIAARGAALSRRLGFGNDGAVWLTSRATALKVHRQAERYRRELHAYRLLADVHTIAGHMVPSLVETDDALMAIEMSIVEPPFVLDFASAYPIAEAPEFPEEVMAEWLAEKREQFGDRWPRAAAVLRALERDHGLRLLDVHPGNIKSESEPET